MKRGHAEALMPLIARVMKASGIAFAALDRIAVTTGPGSFTGLRVGLSAARGIALAAAKPAVGLTTLTAYAAPFVGENSPHPVLSAIDARHDHVYFQLVSGDGGSLVKPKVAPIEEALAASRFGAPHLVGNAAGILADRWPADAPAPIKGRCAGGARHQLGGVGRRRGQSGDGAGQTLLSARARRQAAQGSAAQCLAATHIMMAWLSQWWGGGGASIGRGGEPARRGAAGAAARRLVSPRLGRRRIREHADRAQHAGASLETGAQGDRICGVADGRGRGRNIVDRDRRRASAAAACRAICC